MNKNAAMRKHFRGRKGRSLLAGDKKDRDANYRTAKSGLVRGHVRLNGADR